MKITMMPMLSCSLEFVTGLALIVAPSLVASVLFSVGLTPGGEAVGRVGGFALVSLAVACWRGREEDPKQSVRALFLYNLLAASYLGYIRISGKFSSFLLFPASALHGVLALLFARGAMRPPSKDPTR
jgi:hypothetical protein